MEANNRRNDAVDSIKAFAIICVVLGHCIQYGSGSVFFCKSLFFENHLFKTIYSFHMPLFMLISGFFFGHTTTKNTWSIIVHNKAKSLLIPVFIWSLLPLLKWLFKAVFSAASLPSFYEILRVYLSLSINSLWFLWAIFWCSAIVIIVKRFFNDNYSIHFFLFCLSFFAPDRFWIFSNIYLYKFMYPYFVIGYYVYTRRDNLKSSLLFLSTNKICLLFLLVVFIVLLSFYNTDSYIYTTRLNILNNGVIDIKQLSIDVYRFIIGFFGSLFIILLFLLTYPLLPNHLKSLSLFIGRKTLGVYIISGYLFEFVVQRITKDFVAFMPIVSIFECIIVMAVSLVFTQVLLNYKITRRLLLGYNH